MINMFNWIVANTNIFMYAILLINSQKGEFIEIYHNV